MGILDGKVAIVTGGGQGIGEGIAYALCHEGAKVVNIGRTYEKVKRVVDNITAQGCEATAMQCDIADYEQCEEVVKKTLELYGRIDTLVNNAMTQRFKPFMQSTTEEWQETFNNNVMGTVNMTKVCIPALTETKGRVINFGSGSGTHGSAGLCSYGTTKEAIRGLTKCLAVELTPTTGINFNCVVPCASTPAWEATKAAYPEKLDEYVRGYLIRRPNYSIGDPEEDVGNVVVFLASKYSQYMTGRTLFADGGKSFYR